MGTSYGFKCKTCNYSCLVSPGKDGGMLGQTSDTFSCDDCKNVISILIREPGDFVSIPLKQTFWQKTFKKPIQFAHEYFPNDDIPIENLRCCNCKSKNIKSWDGNCPKCRTEMDWDGQMEHWD